MTTRTASSLSGAWWEQRPRGMVAEGIRKAAEQVQNQQDAPPGMEHYQEDPVGFCVNELGIDRLSLVWSEHPAYDGHKWDGTKDPIATWFQALVDWEDVAVESATGTGKSFGLALMKLWFGASWQGSRCFDYATTKEQLSEYSWMELGKLWPKFKVLFPSADLQAAGLRIRMDGKVREGDLSGWGALGRGVKVGAAEEIAAGAAGMHATHMLITVEEAQGFSHAASRALENTSISPHNLRQYVGNPDSQDDPLHQFAILDTTRHIIISAYDHPNVVINNARDPEWKDLKADVMLVPGAVSRTSIVRRLKKYGREHRFFQSRVRGISPTEHQEALIRQEWIERAVARWETQELRFGLRGLGIDVARSEDGDKGAIADGIGAHLDEVPSFPCPDPVALGVTVAAKMRLGGILERNVGVDTGGGYGGGTVDKLKELGHFVQGINGGSKAVAKIDETILDEIDNADDEEELRKAAVREAALFLNRRAQDHWHLARDLQMDRIALPPDPELHEELRSVRWKPRKGKIVVEEKEEIAKRLGRSPDKADATILWNSVRERLHPVTEVELRAWDADALATEYELRRIKATAPVVEVSVPSNLVERID